MAAKFVMQTFPISSVKCRYYIICIVCIRKSYKVIYRKTFWSTTNKLKANTCMEDGSRFGHFWWFYARVYYVYTLVDQPYSVSNLMVLWVKALGFNARHFAVL